jgi:hypothetical protein
MNEGRCDERLQAGLCFTGDVTLLTANGRFFFFTKRAQKQKEHNITGEGLYVPDFQEPSSHSKD